MLISIGLYCKFILYLFLTANQIIVMGNLLFLDNCFEELSVNNVFYKIPKVNIVLKGWNGHGLRNTFGNKLLLDFDGKPMFAELAVVNMFMNEGWNARWVCTYGRGKMSPFLLTGWEDDEYKKQKYVPIEDSFVFSEMKSIACNNNNSFGGCWDVVAWKERQLLFAELKRKGKDRVRSTQVNWFDAALKSGLSVDNFLFIEWDLPD